MRQNFLLKFLPGLCLALVFSNAFSQNWKEHRYHLPDYDLSGKTILMVVGDDYDHNEVYDVMDLWIKWGAEVLVAGPEQLVYGHTVSFDGMRYHKHTEESSIETDHLLGEVSLEGVDALYFPGGGGPEHLITDFPEITRDLIDQALQKGIPMSAICSGPYVFSLHEALQGKRLTVSPGKQAEMQAFGIDYVREPVVLTGQVITANWPFFESFSMAVAHRLLDPYASLDDIFHSGDCPVSKSLKQLGQIRDFSPEPVPPSKTGQLIANSLGVPWVQFHNQNWKFFVVDDAGLRSRIKEKLLDHIQENELYQQVPEEQLQAHFGRMLDHPSLIIGARKKPKEESGTPIVARKAQEHAVVAAGAYMLLLAPSLDLGAIWFPQLEIIHEDLFSMLDAEGDLEFVFSAVVGYPSVEDLPPVRRPMEEVLIRR